MKLRNINLKKRWIVLAAVVLVVSVTALLWHTQRDPGATWQNTDYPIEALKAEALRTSRALQERGIQVSGCAAKVQYNIAVVSVVPEDKGKLRLSQKNVPEKRYYRLVREEEELPVYIEFQGIAWAL